MSSFAAIDFDSIPTIGRQLSETTNESWLTSLEKEGNEKTSGFYIPSDYCSVQCNRLLVGTLHLGSRFTDAACKFCDVSTLIFVLSNQSIV